MPDFGNMTLSELIRPEGWECACGTFPKQVREMRAMSAESGSRMRFQARADRPIGAFPRLGGIHERVAQRGAGFQQFLQDSHAASGMA